MVLEIIANVFVRCTVQFSHGFGVTVNHFAFS